MKFKIIFLAIFSFTIPVFSQFNYDAPWMQNLGEKNGKATLEEMKASFDNYWLTHNKEIKGSGYNPFMRYVNLHENQLKEDGTVISSQELLELSTIKRPETSRITTASSNWYPVFGSLPYIRTGSWSSGQGRINTVTVDPNNSSIIYVGAPAGGIWKSVNSGTTFMPLFDEFPQIGVSGIVVDSANSNIIYIATGDRDSSASTFVGVYKSLDGGTTWTATGTISGVSKASDIYIHPTNSNILWVATNNGLYKTTNAGSTWNRTLTGNIRDIKVKPTDPTVIYAVSSSIFYKSTNSGDSFTAISSSLPTSSGRLVIDVTPANPNYIYVLSATTGNAFQGIYKSIDSGENFVKSANTTDVFESTQAYYDLALAVSSTNAEEIYTGCLNVWKSTNGGDGFTRMNSWSSPGAASYTHADIHILRFFGSNLFCGSDGGIYMSSNGGTNFTDLSKTIQNGTIYKLAVSKQTSSKMMTGHQDNGGHAYNTNQWKNYYGADGMDVVISPTNENLSYGFIQNGKTLYKSTNAGSTSAGSVASIPTGETGNWVTPLEINNVGELYAGYKKLYKLVGSTWTLQNTGTLGSSNIELIAIDPSNDNIMYVINDKQLYKSIDKGINFTLVYTASVNISNICVHSTNSSIVYILTSGGSGQALKSTDGGVTFVNIASGLPSIGKTVIKHQDFSTNPLFVGTTLGVYYIDDTMPSWTPLDTNLPNVKVTDLEINYIDNNITAATYGRGVWQSALPSVLSKKEFYKQTVSIFPNPTNDIIIIEMGSFVPTSITVFDVSGKTILSKKSFENEKSISLDLEKISKGIYFVKINTDNESIVKKIIKN